MYEIEETKLRCKDISADIIVSANMEYGTTIIVKGLGVKEQVLKIIIEPDYKDNPKVFISL